MVYIFLIYRQKMTLTLGLTLEAVWVEVDIIHRYNQNIILESNLLHVQGEHNVTKLVITVFVCFFASIL